MNAVVPGGRVEVELRDGAGVVEFIVGDDGPGISDAMRQHIFDPFYSGREAGRGLGVGLSKAWRFVTNHGGSIDVEANSPQGARFLIRVPAKPQANEAGESDLSRQ
jgi:signal transduction histidine kinase